MRAFFSDIKIFFRKEKSYVFLAVLALLFYGAAVFTHQASQKNDVTDAHLDAEEVLVQREAEEIKARLKAFGDRPDEIHEKLSESPELSKLAQAFILLFTFFFGIGIALDVMDFRRWVIKKEFVSAVQQTLSVHWNASDIIKVLILFFAWSILLNLLLAAYKIIFSGHFDTSLAIMAHTLALDVIAVLIMVKVIRKKGSGFKDLGFTRFLSRRFMPFLKEIGLGIRTYLAIFPVLLGILFLLVFAAGFFTYEPPPHPLAQMLLEKKDISPWLVTLSLLVACVFGPVVEEIFFRGFFYPALKKYAGIGWATVITAGLFAIVHENIFAFFPIFFLGVVLCHLYEQRRDLTACISLHMLHNTVFIAYFFLVKSILSSGSA
jgi:uncharacterized protein